MGPGRMVGPGMRGLFFSQDPRDMAAPAKKIKLLIGEQDPRLKAMYKRHLPDALFSKRLVESNMEVINLYHNWRPDIILVDDGLPYRNVFSVIKEVRHGAGDKTTIIVVTAKTEDERRQYDVIEAGANQFLAAPFDVKGMGCKLAENFGVDPDKLAESLKGLRKLKLLIAEDDQRVVDLYSKFLSPDTFEIKVASDGKQAFDVYRQWNPEIIVLDIMMPEISGIELLSKIRGMMGDKKTTIIMASSKRDKQHIMQCAKYSVQGYLVKPFSLKTMNEDLRNFHRKHHSRGEE